MSRVLIVLGAVALVVACRDHVAGPQPLKADGVSVVHIQALAPAEAPQVIDDATKVRAIAGSRAFSGSEWWSAVGLELLPLYRLDFVFQDGARARYWLGANSHPPRFPCYALCSGWWIASSDGSGSIDRSRYFALPDSIYLLLLRDLGIAQ